MSQKIFLLMLKKVQKCYVSISVLGFTVPLNVRKQKWFRLTRFLTEANKDDRGVDATSARVLPTAA